MSRLSGLVCLATDAVVEGTSAIERVHLGTAGRTFSILEALPVIGAPAAFVHGAHDAIAAASYGSVRLVASVIGFGAGALTR
ncbi:MAG: hypothetical protein ACJ790_13915 [Myxococcaceae bacterium]